MWDLQSSRAVQRKMLESDTLVILQAFPGYGLPHIYSLNSRRESPVSLRTGGSLLGVAESGYFLNGKKRHFMAVIMAIFVNIVEMNSCSTYAKI